MPLSDTSIKKSLTADKPYTLTDSGGLYLWVVPTGGKLWRWSYRLKLMALTFVRTTELIEAKWE